MRVSVLAPTRQPRRVRNPEIAHRGRGIVDPRLATLSIPRKLLISRMRVERGVDVLEEPIRGADRNVHYEVEGLVERSIVRSRRRPNVDGPGNLSVSFRERQGKEETYKVPSADIFETSSPPKLRWYMSPPYALPHPVCSIL
jgi:hypothetical protein